MNKLLPGFLLLWIVIPTMANAHDGHGLVGDSHYHAPVSLELLGGLIVAALIAIGLSRLVNKRK